MTEQERDNHWEAAMADPTLTDTPIDINLLAIAAKQAMLETSDSLTPSDPTVQRAWQRLSETAEAEGMFVERKNWFSWMFFPRPLAFALTLTLTAGLSVFWWNAQRRDSEVLVIAMRGDVTLVTVSDADAETPALVKELRALNLSPEVSRQTDGTRVDVPWPASPSNEANRWLTEKGFVLSPDGKLHLYLVKPAP